MTTKITNTILMAQNRMLREHIGILNETITVLENFIDAMRSGGSIPMIPFPQNAESDGSPWNAPTDAEVESEGFDPYEFGGDEYRDHRSGGDTWRN